MSNCDFVTFPCGILGQMRHFIVLIPDLCRLSYFTNEVINVVFLYKSWGLIPIYPIYPIAYYIVQSISYIHVHFFIYHVVNFTNFYAFLRSI